MATFTHIMAACDLQRETNKVVGSASVLAEKHNADLHLVHVLEKNEESAASRAHEKLEGLLPPDQRMNLTVHCDALHGPVAKRLADYAHQHEIDVLVVGRSNRSGLTSLFASDVASHLLSYARCRVMVVPLADVDDALPLSRVLTSLHDEFGENLPGEREAAKAQLREFLERQFDMSSSGADAAIDHLEAAGALSWNKGADENDEPGSSAWEIRERLSTSEDITVSKSYHAAVAETPASDLLQRAVSLRATDIHIDPSTDDEYLVRMRIDGKLDDYCRLDADVASHLIHQFKLFAKQDIADPFHAHEGRLQLPSTGKNLQARLTTSPVEGGESVCLRLLSDDSMSRQLDDLGSSTDARAAIADILHRGEGLVLVTGPTGAGKTTTVYSMLRELDENRHLNVVTIEDPVEFRVPFLRQLSVDQQHDMTIAKGLRTMLRMDPDVVFVGEIRDVETAESAMRAASSGRYVFSTLHTRDVASTVTALRDLGISSWSIAGNLTGIISQRLVRRLCPQCRSRQPIDEHDREFFQENGVSAPDYSFNAVGCDHCRKKGFVGRIGTFEVLVANRDVTAAITAGISEAELRQMIRSAGSLSLTADGLLKAADGITSVDEIRRMHWIDGR